MRPGCGYQSRILGTLSNNYRTMNGTKKWTVPSSGRNPRMKEQRLTRIQKTGSFQLLAALRTEKKDASCQRRLSVAARRSPDRGQTAQGRIALSCDARRYKDAKTEI